MGICIFQLFLKVYFILIQERGEGGEREEHQRMRPSRGLSPQPGHVPWLGIEPPTLSGTMGGCPNQQSYAGQGSNSLFWKSTTLSKRVPVLLYTSKRKGTTMKIFVQIKKKKQNNF